MDNDIRRMLNSLFSKNITFDQFGFVQIPDEVVEQAIKPVELDIKKEIVEPEKGVKKRCEICNKKTGLDYYTCGESIFCSNHRYHHTHNCKIDIKGDFKKNLLTNNPKIVKDRLEDRI